MTNSHSKLFKQIAQEDKEPTKECIICYEPLSTATNFCVTECGHEFCFGCMMKHLQRNIECPMCRTALMDESNDSESEEEENDDEYSEVTGSESESEVDEIEDGEDLDNEYDIEELEAAFTAKGYGLKDALSLLMYKFSKIDEKYTKTYIRQLESDIDDMHEELQQECDERAKMSEEDAEVREREFQEIIATLD